MAVARSACSSTSSFEEALLYSLSALKLESTVSLKPEQRMAIQAVYAESDVFVWLPTGFGKSLCFQTLPFLMDHKLGLVGTQKSSAVLVVSPLVALMVDQVRSLRSCGVKSSIITSEAGITREFRSTEASFTSDSLLYCAPEALMQSKWRDVLRNRAVSSRIVAVVVDEAHCVSKWSKDFRPSYSRLGEIRALVPYTTPYMACTATATSRVRKEIIESLEMEGCVDVSVSPDRPNMFYETKQRTDIDSDFLDLVTALRVNTTNTPRVLVYVTSLNTCADLYAHFHYELGSSSYYPEGAPQVPANRLFGMFHSHTPQRNKDLILRSLKEPGGVVRVVFCTVALGMGVDLKGVNSIVHYGAPRSLEDYFQESGRGGRQRGDRANSVVYWKPADCPVRKEPSTQREHEVIEVRNYLESTSECRRVILLAYFHPSLAKRGQDPSRCCDVCRKTACVEAGTK